MVKSVCLYSGGLDSILAIQIIKNACKKKLEIIAVRFVTPFFDYKDELLFLEEKEYLKSKFDVVLKKIYISEDYIDLLYKPKHGFGKNLNPCLDCKILMVKKAKELMTKEKASFVFTGEVLGQRPKSQKGNGLRLIEKEAGLEGKILRPLSAKLLSETAIERSGDIERDRLLDISGRSRMKQLELAKKYGIKYFATPSGGCLLTDAEYARKLKIIREKIGLDENIIKFLKWGRLFIINAQLLVVGRNDLENKKLLKLASAHDLLIQPKEVPGPLCVFLNNSKVTGYLTNKKILKLLCSICARYTLKRNFTMKDNLKIQYGKRYSGIEKVANLRELFLEDILEVGATSEDTINRYSI
ncbi:MAG: tRNA 4-thiouridine(8) synthase ThiI [bacterium]